jgi:neutral ceramidase
MSLKAGFAEIDITPSLGVQKVGWIRVIIADRILDPLFARAAVFECDGRRVGFIQLDLLVITAGQTAQIRRRIEQTTGFPGSDIMLSATHNHAGPATADLGDSRCDDAYVAMMQDRAVNVFSEALARRQDVEIGLASTFEFDVAHNRRLIMRDGTVRSHGSFKDEMALCFEGPVDPQVAVLACRDRTGQIAGTLVNFACHPCHHGGETEISAGFPGVLAQRMRQAGCPVTLYLNGACGNLHTADPRTGHDISKEQAGERLARDVQQALAQMQFRPSAQLRARTQTVQLPYRKITPEEIAGTTHGACRFVDPSAYDRQMPSLLDEIRRQGSQPAEIQVISVAEYDFVGVPAEYFVENGLKIKERSWPRRALVVELANGFVGYVPHREAFLRGGYETTFCGWSKLAPEAGNILADAALDLVRSDR